jgi:hypothetical protein
MRAMRHRARAFRIAFCVAPARRLSGLARGFVWRSSATSQRRSLNNATGEPSNLLGGVGATAADLLLQTSGFAALRSSRRLPCGARARLLGRGLSLCMWRAFAWPLGTVSSRPGSAFPGPFTMPADGRLIGIAVAGLSHMWRNDPAWLDRHRAAAVAAARGVAARVSRDRIETFVRSCAASTAVPAFFVWLGSHGAHAGMLTRKRYDDSDDEELTKTTEERRRSRLRTKRAPSPRSRDDDRRSNRVKREDARKHGRAKPKSPRQPALNLAESEYQLPALGLLAEPVRLHDAQR